MASIGWIGELHDYLRSFRALNRASPCYIISRTVSRISFSHVVVSVVFLVLDRRAFVITIAEHKTTKIIHHL